MILLLNLPVRKEIKFFTSFFFQFKVQGPQNFQLKNSEKIPLLSSELESKLGQNFLTRNSRAILQKFRFIEQLELLGLFYSVKGREKSK